MGSNTPETRTAQSGAINSLIGDSVGFTIYGQCASLKNKRQQVYVQGRDGTPVSKHIPSPMALQFMSDFHAQLPGSCKRGFIGRFRVDVHAWYPSWRSDMDLELLYDLLEASGVIENDRYITEKHAYRHIDRENPRVTVRVTVTGPRPVRKTVKKR